jgi:hypothetical protein
VGQGSLVVLAHAWAEILFRQAKNWLTESGRKTAGSVQHGLEYARSAAEQAAGKGAEYSRWLNPFHGEPRRRFFGILRFLEAMDEIMTLNNPYKSSRLDGSLETT